jgi:cbb3-type cytochrome oxidase subunit 3
VLLIGATIFWLYRISRRKRAERARAVAVAHPEALAA